MIDKEKFNLWVSGCSHVPKDLEIGTRESLADAIRQSEFGGDEGGPAFDWNIAIHLGDFSATQASPVDEEGEQVVKQFKALKKHSREQFYCLAGNHDACPHTQPCQWWFRKWIDPLGENTEFSGVHPDERPFPIEGTWERYSFSKGNLLFLMMSDRNNDPPPVGRGEYGGYPAGAVSEDTFKWWKNIVESNKDKIIITCHHHMLKNTTTASGPYEGFYKDENGQWQCRYHGYFPDGGPEGASYLYFLGNKPDAQAFESYFEANPGAIDLWLGGHTHSYPDDNFGDKRLIESKWNVNFINAAALSLYHTGSPKYQKQIPMSRLLTFEEGSDKVKVQCYLHTSHYAPQGWYKPVEQILDLNNPFRK